MCNTWEDRGNTINIHLNLLDLKLKYVQLKWIESKNSTGWARIQAPAVNKILFRFATFSNGNISGIIISKLTSIIMLTTAFIIVQDTWLGFFIVRLRKLPAFNLKLCSDEHVHKEENRSGISDDQRNGSWWLPFLFAQRVSDWYFPPLLTNADHTSPFRCNGGCQTQCPSLAYYRWPEFSFPELNLPKLEWLWGLP